MEQVARLRQGVLLAASAGLLAPTPTRLRYVKDSLETLTHSGLEVLATAPLWWQSLDAVAGTPSARAVPEHVRLFGSGTDGALCPLIESHWVGSNLHGGPAAIASAHRVLLADMGLTTAGAHPPDHLVVTLEALASLCGREADARADADDEATDKALAAEEDFLRRLERWVPALTEAVTRNDRSGVYGPLVEAIEATVLHDLDLTRIARVSA